MKILFSILLLIVFVGVAQAQDYMLTPDTNDVYCGAGSTNELCCVLATFLTGIDDGVILYAMANGSVTNFYYSAAPGTNSYLKWTGTNYLPVTAGTIARTWYSDSGAITNVTTYTDGLFISWTTNGAAAH